MLTLIDVPDEVYKTALEIEELEVWEDGRNEEAYYTQTDERGWTNGGLDTALANYILLGETYKIVRGLK